MLTGSHCFFFQVLQPSDFFRNENFMEMIDESLVSHVDIDRCVLYGLLKTSNSIPKKLTAKEKNAVFTLENFDNLTLYARCYVISGIVEKLEKRLESMSDEELKNEDDFGRTPSETLDIYKKLKEILIKRVSVVQKLNVAHLDKNAAQK